jgi:hypothetical protein
LGGAEGVIEKGPNVVLPKLITVTCDFTAIHEEDLGWSAGDSSDASFANEAFPYGAVLAETEVAPAASSKDSDDPALPTAQSNERLKRADLITNFLADNEWLKDT